MIRREHYRGWLIEADWQDEGWGFRAFPPDECENESDGKLYPTLSSAKAAARRYVLEITASLALMDFLDHAYECGLIADEENWALFDSLPYRGV